jgi:hypothetical protein
MPDSFMPLDDSDGDALNDELNCFGSAKED